MSRDAWYPRDPAERRRTMTGDAVVAGLLVLFALLAVGIHDAVGDLGQMGRDIREAGDSLRASGRSTGDEIRSAFGAAADAGGSLPVVGGGLAGPLRSAGDRLAGSLEKQTESTGADLARSGAQGESDAGRIATLAAWVTFLIPTSLLLAVTLPGRLAQIRRLRARAPVGAREPQDRPA